MATKKKLYRQVIQIEILSEEPIPDGLTLSEIDDEMTNGGWSGQSIIKKDEVVTGRKAAKMVMAQGSDPSFFGMNEFGNETDEDATNDFLGDEED